MTLVPALIKASLLVVAGKSFTVAWTPPNPPARKMVRKTFFERRGPDVAKALKAIFLSTIGLDAIIAIMLSELVSPKLSATAHELLHTHICLSTTTSPNQLASTLLSPHSLLLLFVALLAMAATGRAWCYRTLGSHFRFEVSIQEKHRLVTSGPYAYARHPSYLAMYGVYIGSTGVLASKGTWSRECVLQTPLSAFVDSLEGRGEFGTLLDYRIAEYVMLVLLGAMFTIFVCAERGLWGRLEWEDDVLRKEFGKEWDEYARRVPWRIVPFLF